jgi:hypothetical protein
MRERKLIEYLQDHLLNLSNRLGLETRIKEPVSAYIAGGVAVNYWTGYRMSDDVDIKWSHRVPIPPEMQVFEIQNPDDELDWRLVTLDGGFSDVLGSFPPDWESACHEVAVVGKIKLMVISPVDLAVSKVARFQDNDREDIRQLAAHGLVDPEAFRRRAMEALDFFVGDTTFILHNIEDAVEMIRKAIDDPEP